MEGDGECWQLAYQIYGLSERESFAADWQISGERWLQEIAAQGFADVGYLQPFADRYQTEWAREVGLPVDKVVLNPVVNSEIWVPGMGIAETVMDDARACHSNWRECGKALDDVSVALSTVAVGCGVTGLTPCAAVASAGSTATSVWGTVLTIVDLASGGESGLDDAGMATITTIVGGKWGSRPRGTGLVGLGSSVAQWIWDHLGGQ